MKLPLICLISLVALSTLANAQTAYRWVDKNGKVTYSDEPPPKEIKKVEERNIGGNSTIETSELPFVTQKAAKDFPVTLYTSPDCGGDCNLAREFLNKRGIPFSEVSITTPEQGESFKKTFNASNILVPSLSAGSQKQQGFLASGWGGLLDNVGYPSSAVPGKKPKVSPAPEPTPATPSSGAAPKAPPAAK